MKRYLYLTPVLGGPGAPRYPVGDESQLIGRSDSANISLLEPTISRRHATIQLKGKVVRLRDLGSKHGTFVNSRRVTSAELRVGDIVVFGLSLVLRLEASSEPVFAPESVDLPADTPTLIDPLEHLTASTVGQPPAVRPYTGRDTAGEQPVDAAAVCTSLLPEIHVRLSELRENLRRMVNDGVDETDPYPILASVESVLSMVSRAIQVAGVEEDVVPAVVRLRRLVQRVVDRVAPTFAERKVKFLSDVGEGYEVQCDAARLEGVVALLLRNAGRASPAGNPVEIMATEGEDTVSLAVSHLGQEYPADVLKNGAGRGGTTPLHRDMKDVRHLVGMLGGSITVESRPGIGSTVRLSLPVPVPPRR